MLEIISPYYANTKKRLVKAPRVYVADSGICAALLRLRCFEDIAGHSVFGFLWEQIVISHIRAWFPNAEVYYYRTAGGDEADLVVRIGRNLYCLECKMSGNPMLSKGNYNAINDISPLRTFVVIPFGSSWPMKDKIDVLTLPDLKARLQ
jgi:predicted AAA+ superfamily ATPase